MPVWSCVACAVETADQAEPPPVCLICADERQYVPVGGQVWTTQRDLAASGHRVTIDELEPGLFALGVEPGVGIGQHALFLVTDAGNLLWDPPGYVDAAAAQWVRERGGLAAIVASHPHMYGAQVSWSRALGDVPVWVAAQDRAWVQRDDAVLREWWGDFEVLPGVTLRAVGGHFPGSAVAVWAAGAEGRGVLLAGDTVAPGPSRRWVTFKRSFPNDIPLSGAVVDRVATAIIESRFDRIYGAFGNIVPQDARAVVRASADRYVAWVRGDFDHLT